jgi:hypothetical protein
MKKAGVVLLGLGIVVLAVTVVWMTAGLDWAMRIPDGQDETQEYTGDITFYVDLAAGTAYPAGQEVQEPFEVTRRIYTLDEETTGSAIVFQEDITKAVGASESLTSSVYVLDRGDALNLADGRAYDWQEANVVDRSGTYFPLFPSPVDRNTVYPVWKAELGRAGDAVFVEEETVEGVKLYVFKGAMDQEPVATDYAAMNGFPESIPYSAIAGKLAAAGFDNDAFTALAMTRLKPEDAEELVRTTAQPVPLDYFWGGVMLVGIEPQTGFPMYVRETAEELSMSADLTGLVPLFNTLMKYRDDPVLGPYVKQLATIQVQLAAADPQKIFSYTYRQTDESVAKEAVTARSNLDKIKLAKTYLPIAGFTLGGLLLAAGIILVVFARRKKPAS